MIKNYSLKCGLSNNLDGTEDDRLKIRGIEDYWPWGWRGEWKWE